MQITQYTHFSVLRDLIFLTKLKLGFLNELNHCLDQLLRISMRL